MEVALTALLASVAGGRRYWGRKPQAEPARPYVILQIAGNQPDYVYAGPSGYSQKRVQVDVYADSYTAALNTAGSVVALLSGHRGGAIQAIFIDAQRDLPAADPGEVTTLFRRSIDIIVHHGEPT